MVAIHTKGDYHPMVYRWKDGHSITGVSPQEAGEELERIRESNHDDLTPSLVIEAAKPQQSPIHGAFTWNEKEAARERREDQARSLIRSLVEVTYRDDGDGLKTRAKTQAYVSIGSRKTGSLYVTTARAMSDERMREKVIADAMAQLDGWRKRFSHLDELAELFAAIEREAERRQGVA